MEQGAARLPKILASTDSPDPGSAVAQYPQLSGQLLFMKPGFALHWLPFAHSAQVGLRSKHPPYLCTAQLGSVLGSWGKPMRGAGRNNEWWKRRRTPTQYPSTYLHRGGAGIRRHRREGELLARVEHGAARFERERHARGGSAGSDSCSGLDGSGRGGTQQQVHRHLHATGARSARSLAHPRVDSLPGFKII